MADHIREQVLDAVASTLSAALSGVTVTKDRFYRYDPEDLPAINVEQGPDELLDGSPYPYQDHAFNVILVIMAQATDDPIEDANNVERDAHVALRAARQLGMPTKVHDSWWVSTDEPELSTEARKRVARLPVTWRVFYRTDLDDPSTVT